ncbi:methyltransferase domain-containing protein [Microlunatus speluncae]|uniref:methyltransferase domain-containing protein n=1 Tax=Microlunatus speluncae TaxID=2594267 RepID=UPI00126663CE|nr:methyltransferase domain-containing protein [Microlunatus speluncae]
MRTFDELIAEAAAADVSGWDFSWLDGRATEERPPWGYARLLAERLGTVGSAVDLDTGGGEVVAEAPRLPARMAVTETWPPNAERARRLLGPRGAEVYEPQPGGPLPFPDGSFELVTSRHPIKPDWPEISRILQPGGHYFAQHVGGESARALSEFFLGPLPDEVSGRDPEVERRDAEQAGLTVVELRTFRARMEFFDVGAVVWILRRCVWWLPDFTVEKYHEDLVRMDRIIRDTGSFEAHATRHLIDAVR